jgi:PAS domain S-box-containing protein
VAELAVERAMRPLDVAGAGGAGSRDRLRLRLRMAKVDNNAPQGDLASGSATRASRCTLPDPDDAIVIVDNNGMITSWNPAAEKLLGYPADAVVGQSLALIIPPKHRLRHVTGFHKAMDAARLANGGRPARVTATTADGRFVPLTMTLGLWGLSTQGASGVVAVLRRAGYSALLA